MNPRGIAVGLLFAMGAFSAVPALASDWIYAVTGSDKGVWYFDAESVKKVSDGYGPGAVRVWIKADFSLVKSEVAREMKELVYLRCDEEQYKVLSSLDYAANGSVLRSSVNSYAAYSPVVPDSVLSGMMQSVCKSVAAS